MGAQTDRIVKIENLLRRHRRVNFQTLQQTLEVSRATVKRDLAFLRDRMGCPIVYDRAEDSYRIDASHQVGDRHEIPGLWFNGKELHALLTAHQLLDGLDPNGALSRHVTPLLDRIHQLIGHTADDQARVMQRVRVVQAGQRPVEAPCFEAVCSALLASQRLRFAYFTRSRQSRSEREVSPQRLTHHRHTWYLDAWCHQANALRRFALDAMGPVSVLDEAALDVPLAEVQQALDGGYGIYAGNQVQWATLRFSARAAQWVAHEHWHPDQQLQVQPDGTLQMRLPFVDMTELRMDILRHGPDVEVIEPAALRQAVAEHLQQALAVYSVTPGGRTCM